MKTYKKNLWIVKWKDGILKLSETPPTPSRSIVCIKNLGEVELVDGEGMSIHPSFIDQLLSQ